MAERLPNFIFGGAICQSKGERTGPIIKPPHAQTL
jgi:hypothetical protein